MSALLTVQGVSKRYGGVQALKDVSLTVQTGQIHGLNIRINNNAYRNHNSLVAS